MNKKTLLSIASLMFAMGLTACGGNGGESSKGAESVSTPDASSVVAPSTSVEQGHVHHYGTEYKSDKANHWHVCECGEVDEYVAHTFVKQASSIDATCSKKGLLVEKCSVCGFERSVVTETIAHKFEIVEAETTYPDCDTAGHIVEKCKDCDETRTIEAAAFGHIWVADPTDPRNAEPTHKHDGIKVEKCTRCHGTQEVHTPSIPHEWTLVEGAETTTASGKTLSKWQCECGSVSYTLNAYDFDALTAKSNATGVEGYDPGPDSTGIRIAGNGSISWKMPVGAAGKYYFSACADDSPSSIAGTKIEQKNAVTVNGEATTLLVKGSYAQIGLVPGKFTEIKLAAFEVTAEMANTEVTIAITQKSSSRLYWGGVVRVTPAE